MLQLLRIKVSPPGFLLWTFQTRSDDSLKSKFISFSLLDYMSCENCFKPYANNKGVDQPAHPRNLISTFVVHCLNSAICIFAISKVSRFQLAPVLAEQAGLNLTGSKKTNTCFCMMWLI